MIGTGERHADEPRTAQLRAAQPSQPRTTVVDDARRIAFLEVVRGLAAAMVVVHHVASANFAGYRAFARYVDPGRVGVVAFFLVSGYVITRSLEHTSVRTFAVRRFFRLFPVYWVAMIALVAVVPHYLPGHDASSPGLALFGLNVLMLNGFVGSLSIIGPAWTLSIELVFYVQAAMAKSRGRLDASVSLGWFWLACYLASCALKQIGGVELPRSLPLLMFVAALGQAVYLRDRRRTGSTTWIALLAAGAVLVPLGAQLGVDPAWGPLNYDLSTLVGVCFFGGCYLLRELRFPGALVWLGSISYAAYLFHPVVIALLERIGVAGWSELAGTSAAVLLVAWVVHRAIERPCIELGRRRASALMPLR